MQRKISNYEKLYSFEERKNESTRIISMYDDRVPIILEKYSKNEEYDVNKNKFLVPKKMSIGKFIFIVRKRYEIKNEESIYIFINEKIPKQSELIENLYINEKNEDGILYIFYDKERIFG